MSEKFQIFPPLDDALYAALKDDIEAHGIRQAVLVDQEGNTLDGYHRRAIAAELGIDCPTKVVPIRDDAEGYEIARAVNALRRHLSLEQRDEIILELHAKGHSAQAIASAADTSARTVGRVVATKTPSGSAPAEPRYVKGKDGKRYPSKQPDALPLVKQQQVMDRLLTLRRGGDDTALLDFRSAYGPPQKLGKDQWAVVATWLEDREEAATRKGAGVAPDSPTSSPGEPSREGASTPDVSDDRAATETAARPPRTAAAPRSPGKPSIPKGADKRRHGGEIVQAARVFLQAWKAHGGAWDVAYGQTATQSPDVKNVWDETATELLAVAQRMTVSNLDREQVA